VIKVFVDSNVFLRFFTRDDRGQHERAVALFRQAAAGKIALVSGPPVLFEIAWTLRSAYKQSNQKVLETLSAILALDSLKLTDAQVVEEALALAKVSNEEFADTYLAALSREAGIDEVATFNRKHFEKLGVTLRDLSM
jgi:predicted nucleic acid-binding protein